MRQQHHRWWGLGIFALLVLWCCRDFLPEAGTYLFDARTSGGPVDDKTWELRAAQSDALDLTLMSLLSLGSMEVDPVGTTHNPRATKHKPNNNNNSNKNERP